MRKKIYITETEKATPAYRKKLEQENELFKKSLENTQNQASALQERNAHLINENGILIERLKGTGLATFVNNFALLLGGAAISLFIETSYFMASVLALLAFVFSLISFQASNIIDLFLQVYSFFISKQGK